MRWSLKIAEIAGIGVFVHWTFLVLLAFLGIYEYVQSQQISAVAIGLGYIVSLFGCVVLHELGHALTARAFGVPTKDITLLPIGGLARLQRIPEKPMEEFLVAIAGPAVNLVIAGICLVVLAAFSELNTITNVKPTGGDFVAWLMMVNVVLLVFNLLPAFPMDGGRVLRALLATQMDYVAATRAAVGVGQGMAILFGFVGLFTNPFLVFIAIFVYLGAGAELQQAESRVAFRGIGARATMMTEFRTLRVDDSLGGAADALLAGSQVDFPVLDGERFAGILRRGDLIQGLRHHGPDHPVRDAMTPECLTVEEDHPLEELAPKLREEGCSAIPVLGPNGSLIGLVTLENIGEWLMVRSAIQQNHET